MTGKLEQSFSWKNRICKHANVDLSSLNLVIISFANEKSFKSKSCDVIWNVEFYIVFFFQLNQIWSELVMKVHHVSHMHCIM